MKSVCEITAVSGSGACGQSNSKTGFLTTYTYDPLGNLLTVAQNAQPGAIGGQQSRTYVFDELSRLTSETNPESGTTNYTYDTDPGGDSCASGARSSPGDMVKKVDAIGHFSCYIYDALHRVTDVGNALQGNSSSPCKRFRYDKASNGVQAQPTGSTLVNLVGRLVEVETDSASMITDEWFSYDADGRPTDFYESTPHSGGYYHSSASYWANGGLDTLGLFSSAGASLIPMQTYGADGEGRPSSVTAASGQNPVSSVTYTASGTAEPIGSLTNVTFGSLDSDSYQYNPSTGRMTKYTLSVNGQSEVGTLTWNANGTLGQLAITDPFNTQNNQTCTNTYDDLARISGNSCGSTWAQTFSFDPFGNVSKSGSISWIPGYDSAQNQYTTPANCVTLGGAPCYDADGNLLNDTFNTYTWNAYGDLASANGAAVTYDAFDRMVENHGGTYEFAYAPTGTHPLAWLQGQTLSGAQLPLPGNAFAIYNGSGLAQYNHADWLGSARLFSTSARAASPAMSYAPFGEGYAGGIQDIQFTSFSSSYTVSGNESQGGTLDDFTFRRYSPVQGRWISPDPAGLGAVNPANPQTWNRYAYVANNPSSYTDPYGLNRCGGNCGCDSDHYDCGSSGGSPSSPGGGDTGYYFYGMGISAGTAAWLLSSGGYTVEGAGPGSSVSMNGQVWAFVAWGGTSATILYGGAPLGGSATDWGDWIDFGGGSISGSMTTTIPGSGWITGVANNGTTLRAVQWQSNCLNQVSSQYADSMGTAQKTADQAFPSFDWAALLSLGQAVKYATRTVAPTAGEFLTGIGEAAAFGLGVRALYYEAKAGSQAFVAELNLGSGYATCASMGMVHH